MDLLPTALCYYVAGGMPALVNQKMTKLCLALTGQEVLNGEQFWDSLKKYKNEEGIVVEIPGGAFYSFSQKRLTVGNRELYEIIAMDVTASYQLSQKLKEENEHLEQMNERMRKYNQDVEMAAGEKEILADKVHIHDNIGHLLLSAKRVLSMPAGDAQQEREQLLRLWQQDTTLFISNQEEQCCGGRFLDLETAAASLGIEIDYCGHLLVKDRRASDTLSLIVHECLTNAFSHAQATRLEVCLEEADECYNISCTNDGERPEEPVKEGGGLSSLRNHIEEEGGMMSITSYPAFKLSVTLPKGSDEFGKKYRVMVVEDQAMPRQLFEMPVDSSEYYELAVSIDNATTADIYCLNQQIDLVLMDVVTRQGVSGLDAAQSWLSRQGSVEW